MKNSIAENKNTLDEINSRLEEGEEINLEDRVMESNKPEQGRERERQKEKRDLDNSVTPSSITTFTL